MNAGEIKESVLHHTRALRRPLGRFIINAPPGGLENICNIEPNLASWPSNLNHLFLRLQIKGWN
jgi:hypothetical protein